MAQGTADTKQGTVESERKFVVPRSFRLPDLAGRAGIAQLGDPEEQHLDATYFDTPDLRLARHQVTVRRRIGGNDAGWHAKVGSVDGDRIEHRRPLGDAEEEPPADLLADVRAIHRGRPLRAVARIRTDRTERPVRDADGRVLALIADDDARAERLDSQGAAARWREVEVELVDGDKGVLDEVEKALRAAGARPAGRSKLARVLGDQLPVAGGDRRGGKLPGWFRAVVDYARHQRDTLIDNDPAARQGDEDGVHDMRVAIRRLRSTLRTYRGLWDRERGEALRAELKWLADQLGPVRDGQVMAGRLSNAVAAEPRELVVGPVRARMNQQLNADTAGALDRLRTALDSDRYLRLLDDLDGLVDSDPDSGRGRGWVRRRTRRSVRRADRMLDEAMALPEDDVVPRPDAGGVSRRDVGLHEARKAYKRARYAVEAVAPRVGGTADRLIKRLKKLQDVLGTHQDSVITRSVIREQGMRAHQAGDNAFTFGLLHGRQQAAAERVLRRLPRVRRRARRGRLRSWLR